MERIEISNREEYISLINDCKEKEKHIMAVKAYIDKGMDMQIHIIGNIAKFKSIDGKTPISEIKIGDTFLSDSLVPKLESVKNEMTEIDTAFSLFLLNNA